MLTSSSLCLHPRRFALLPKWGAAMPLPPHFYRQLASTATGARMLLQSGHLGPLLDAAFGCPLRDASATSDSPSEGLASGAAPGAHPGGPGAPSSTAPAAAAAAKQNAWRSHGRTVSGFDPSPAAPTPASGPQGVSAAPSVPLPSPLPRGGHIGPVPDSLQRRAAVLTLGQVASSPHGFAALSSLAPDFVLRLDAMARGLVLVVTGSAVAAAAEAAGSGTGGIAGARTPAAGFCRCRSSTAAPSQGKAAAAAAPPPDAPSSSSPQPLLRFSAVRDPLDDVGLRPAAMHALATLASGHPTGYAQVVTLGWCPPTPPPGAMLRAAGSPAAALLPFGALPSAGGASGLVTSYLQQSLHAAAAPGAGSGAGAAQPWPQTQQQFTAVTVSERASLVLPPQVLRASYALALQAPQDAAASATAESLLDDTGGGEDAFLAAERLPPMRPEWQPVLARIGELSARLTQREARSALARMRAERPELFGSPGLYAHVHALLSRYTLTLPVRRFIHAQFERVSFSDRAWDFSQPALAQAAPP
jgi:hypothetical protein